MCEGIKTQGVTGSDVSLELSVTYSDVYGKLYMYLSRSIYQGRDGHTAARINFDEEAGTKLSAVDGVGAANATCPQRSWKSHNPNYSPHTVKKTIYRFDCIGIQPLSVKVNK